MSPTSDDPRRAAAPGPRRRPPWLGPVLLAVTLVVVTLVCVGLSVWGP